LFKLDNTNRSSDGSYGVLQSHRSKNKPSLPPNAEHLDQCRRKQGQGNANADSDANTDSDANADSDANDNANDNTNNDSGAESEALAVAVGKKKRRQQSSKEATPMQEGFYPAQFLKAFDYTKDLVYLYLLLIDLFPQHDPFIKIIDEYLLEGIAYVERELEIAIPDGMLAHFIPVQC
jgi:hypothetical protein